MVPFRRRPLLVLLLVCFVAVASAPVQAGKLTDAVKARDVALVHSLLAAGEYAQEKVRGDYPLNVASLFGPVETVEALLEAGADIERPGRDGFHPLHNAVLSGRKEIVAILILRGAVVDAKDRKGRTPLVNFAIFGGTDIEIARLLLVAGANPNIEDAKEFDGATALQYAAGTGNHELAALLIAAHADVNHRSALGDTPLHQAAYDEHLEVARLLIVNGADVNLANNFGKTPLDDVDEAAMRKLLVDAGAK